MTLVALIGVAAAVTAAAWALRPGARYATDPDEATRTAGFSRFLARFPQRPQSNGDGDADGNGSPSWRDHERLVDPGHEAASSPVITPAARADVDAEDHYLEGFDLRSVARFAIRFFTCVLAVFIVTALGMWLLASVLGLVDAFERFMRGIGFTDFQMLSLEFLLGVALIGVAFGVLMVVMTVLAAALYNALAHRWEGVRIFVSSGRAPASAAVAPVPMSMDGAEPRRILTRAGRRARP